MTAPAGTVWDVDRIVRVVDGDSLRVIRSRRIDLDGRHYRLTDDDPQGVLLRLNWVDTPERGDPKWHDARYDLLDWIDDRNGVRMHVVCFESAGWDRILCDLRDALGASASQWLMADRGWPPYVEGQ
jgi:endonuclease YncB( thermonuclease family)